MQNENVKIKNPAAIVCEHTNTENEDRICSTCGAGPLYAGFVFDGGRDYYCTEQCLHVVFTEQEWAELYDDGRGDSYYTEWEEDDVPQSELDDDDDDDDDDAPDPETCTLDDAIQHALASLESDAIDVLETCAARYARELAAARAELAALRETMAQDFAQQPGVLALRVQFTPADGCSDDDARAALENDLSLYLQSLAHGGLPVSVKNAQL